MSLTGMRRKRIIRAYNFYFSPFSLSRTGTRARDPSAVNVYRSCCTHWWSPLVGLSRVFFLPSMGYCVFVTAKVSLFPRSSFAQMRVSRPDRTLRKVSTTPVLLFSSDDFKPNRKLMKKLCDAGSKEEACESEQK